MVWPDRPEPARRGASAGRLLASGWRARQVELARGDHNSLSPDSLVLFGFPGARARDAVRTLAWHGARHRMERWLGASWVVAGFGRPRPPRAQ